MLLSCPFPAGCETCDCVNATPCNTSTQCVYPGTYFGCSITLACECNFTAEVCRNGACVRALCEGCACGENETCASGLKCVDEQCINGTAQLVVYLLAVCVLVVLMIVAAVIGFCKYRAERRKELKRRESQLDLTTRKAREAKIEGTSSEGAGVNQLSETSEDQETSEYN